MSLYIAAKAMWLIYHPVTQWATVYIIAVVCSMTSDSDWVTDYHGRIHGPHWCPNNHSPFLLLPSIWENNLWGEASCHNPCQQGEEVSWQVSHPTSCVVVASKGGDSILWAVSAGRELAKQSQNWCKGCHWWCQRQGPSTFCQCMGHGNIQDILQHTSAWKYQGDWWAVCLLCLLLMNDVWYIHLCIISLMIFVMIGATDAYNAYWCYICPYRWLWTTWMTTLYVCQSTILISTPLTTSELI